MERYELPEGWEWLKLPEVADLIMGQSPPGSTYNKDGNGLPFYQGKADFGSHFPTPRVYCSKPKKVAQPGDILMSVRAPVGPTNLVNHECAIGRGLSIIRPKEGIPANYLRAYFTLIEQLIAELGTGSTFTSISRSDLENLDVPVSPLLEQQRVVAKIESLFEQSRAARTALTRVPVLMAQFRRAVLASAFRGELVEPDPNDEPAVSLLERVNEARISNASKKLVHAEVVDTNNLPEIPGTWAWTTLEVLAEIRNGVTKGRDLNRFETVEIPYLRVANVQDGYLDLKEMKTIKVKKTEFEKVRLKPNDILFIEGGDRDKLGRGTVWRGEIDVCTHQNHVHCARLYLQDVVPDWVSFASQLSYARDYFFSAANQTVNLASLNSTQLKGLPVPLPPVNEQQRILEKIKALFAQADIIEQAASVSLRRAEQVDQSILARAFRGELG
jgi:type I restriction enzyme S subunit